MKIEKFALQIILINKLGTWVYGFTEVLGENGYALLGVICFAAMAFILGKTALKK